MKIILILKLTIMKKNEIDLNRFSKRKAGIRKDTRNAVIYTRVSSKEQAEKYSLQVQADATRKYAEYYNLPIIATFGDTFESAKSDVDRPEFERLLEFVENPKNDIKYIIVHTLDRFSRTGGSAIYIMDGLEKTHDIIVQDTTRPPITIRKASDNLSQNVLLMVGNYSNEDRREKCKLGMKQALMNGDWPHKTPFGYDSIKKNGKRELKINEKGKMLKQAFIWRIKQQLPIQEISDRLRGMGLKSLTPKRLHRIFENIFYAGYLSSSTIEGEVIKGNHEPLIQKKEFLLLREIADRNKKNKNPETKPKDLYPLLGNIKCSCCNTYLTAYKKVKGGKIYNYYKCNKKACKLNRPAITMHTKFEDLLCYYSLPQWILPLFTKIMEATFRDNNADQSQTLRILSDNISGLKRKLNSVEEKYLEDLIDKEMYTKHSTTLKQDIELMERKIYEVEKIKGIDLSNFLQHGVKLSLKLPEAYAEGTSNTKRTIVKTVFPEGLYYDRSIEHYRTIKVNEFFGVIRRISGVYEKQKSGKVSDETSLSALVARRGIEPLFPE